MVLRYLSIISLCLSIIHGAVYQTPIKATISTEEMTLKSIYRHSTSSSSKPGLFQRMDMTNTMSTQSSPFKLKGIQGTTFKLPQSQIEHLFAMRRSGQRLRSFDHYELQPTDYLLPDVSDHASVLTLAEMSYNAYTEIGKDGLIWYDLGSEWQVNSTFGWDRDGIRGHVFGNKDNSLLVIGFKGTTAGLFGGEPTGDKDKLNDNMLFSCCCGKVNKNWSPVCGCNEGKDQFVCNQACLDKTLIDSEFYYDYAMNIFLDVVTQYPEATVWVTGHSLGGAIAALLGQTFGVPAVGFESPGDRLASQRLHLPRQPGAKFMPIWHFGHTADPIYIGVCTGPMSGCYYAGFAMETRCHIGKSCVWDTVKNNGWRVNIAHHRIGTLIEDILKKPNEFPIPDCKAEVDCDDCGLWTFEDERDLLSANFIFNNRNKL